MKLIVKALVGCSSLAGGACAVSIPVVMSSGKEPIKQKLVLTKCDDTDLSDQSELKFGDNGERNVCGKWKEDKNQEFKNIGEEYTDLLSELGDKQGGEEDQDLVVKAAGNGTQQCTASGIRSPWIVKEQYLGLCGDYEEGKTKFFKRERKVQSGEEKSEGGLWTCDHDCGTPSDKEEKSDSGKQVMFYRKKIENPPKNLK